MGDPSKEAMEARIDELRLTLSYIGHGNVDDAATLKKWAQEALDADRSAPPAPAPSPWTPRVGGAVRVMRDTPDSPHGLPIGRDYKVEDEGPCAGEFRVYDATRGYRTLNISEIGPAPAPSQRGAAVAWVPVASDGTRFLTFTRGTKEDCAEACDDLGYGSVPTPLYAAPASEVLERIRNLACDWNGKQAGPIFAAIASEAIRALPPSGGEVA